jgi:HAD superfamily hydrolase (TIGR01549 family)
MATLVKEPFFEVVPRFFGMTLEELWAVKERASWVDFEYGRIDEDEHTRRFFTDGRDWDVEGLKREMVEHYEWTDGMKDLVRRLSEAGYAMHVLSNYTPWYHLIEAKLRVSEYVAWSFVSCDIGHRKPDASIYRYVVDRLGATPEECLFVDDRPKNIEGAAAVGMPGHLFTDTPALEAALVALGLSFESPA